MSIKHNLAKQKRQVICLLAFIDLAVGSAKKFRKGRAGLLVTTHALRVCWTPQTSPPEPIKVGEGSSRIAGDHSHSPCLLDTTDLSPEIYPP